MRVFCALTTVALCMTPSLAAAQGIAATFDELRLLVRPGETITITGESGNEVTGKLADLSHASLSLTVDRQAQEWSERDVRRISHRYQDSLGNGALIGLAVGGGVAALGIAASNGRHYDASAGEVALAIGIYAGIGAAIGTGVDALVRSTRVVFEKPVAASASVRLVPMLNRTGVGLRLAFGF